MKTKVTNIIQIIAGIIILIFGIILCLQDNYYRQSYLSSTSFGGDFYTYMYKATVKIYNELGKCINTINELPHYLGYLLIALGIFNTLKGIRNMQIDKEKTSFYEAQLHLLSQIACSSNNNETKEIPSLLGANMKPVVAVTNNTNTNGIRRTVTCTYCGLVQPFGSTRCTSCSQLLNNN